jgi:tetratricopeptide (TPR) repeat protein
VLLLSWLALGSPVIAQQLAVARRSDAPVAAEVRPPDQRSVQALIAQLGHDDFELRRQAEAQLLALGSAAFDHLQEAAHNPDLEIATQAQYLLHRVTVEFWTRPTDSPQIKELMSHYADLSHLERIELVEDLSRLPEAAGVSALARIAHFDLNDSLAELAASGILHTWKKQQSQATAVGAAIELEIGNSQREATQWLQTYVAQLRQPETISSKWLPLLDAEIGALAAPAGEKATDALQRTTLARLLQFCLDLGVQNDDDEFVFQTLKRRVDMVRDREDAEGIDNGLAGSMLWVIQAEQWRALTRVEEHYRKQIGEKRLLVYLAAYGRAAQNQEEQAGTLARQAFDFAGDPNETSEARVTIGEMLAELGRLDWAEREWRHVMEESELASPESIDARRWLALWCLHDRGADQEAAELLNEVCEALRADSRDKKGTRIEKEYQRYLLRELEGQREYFLACHLEGHGDFAGQKEHLDKAIRINQQDPDVLIAMYRLQGVDQPYRAQVEQRIRQALEGIEQQIADSPETANHYNHWAWLVSNTTGDSQRAVRYSLKSLELNPDTASYLDTLGRCYYAAGDLKNAIKYQRQAVKKQPQVRVMQRQLKFFEQELGKRK